MTSRREFIIGAGGAVALSAVTRKGAKAQEKIRRVGVLMNAANDDPEAQACLAALQQGLADLGWVTDRNLRIDQRWAVGEVDSIPARCDRIGRPGARRSGDRGRSHSKRPTHHADDTNCLFAGGRSGRSRLRREIVATGRQHHWLHAVRVQLGWEMVAASS